MTETAVAPAPSVLPSEAEDVLRRLMLVRDVLAPDLTMDELRLFAMVAARSGLDPFARQVHAMKRGGRMVIITGIDGYRSLAARTGEYDGQDEPVYGPDCRCGKGSHPEWATVRVYRRGFGRPVGATAYWHEYVPDPGPTGRGDAMWRKMPHVMLAKVAEALALRKAFPWDPTKGVGIGGDVYTAEELAQADTPPPPVLQVPPPNEVAPPEEDAPPPADAPKPEPRRPGLGMGIREFADAVKGLNPGHVAAVRERLYPGVRSVVELTAAQREHLYEVLMGEGDEPAPPEPEPELEPEPEPELGPDPVVSGCPPSPFDGAPCDREPGHAGRHRSRDMKQTW